MSWSTKLRYAEEISLTIHGQELIIRTPNNSARIEIETNPPVPITKRPHTKLPPSKPPIFTKGSVR